MDLMTLERPALVAEHTIPNFGLYGAAAVSLDTALDQIVSSTAPISRAVNGHGAPWTVAQLISSRLVVGSGVVEATAFIAHNDQLLAVSGTIVAVDESAIHFADEHGRLHAWHVFEVIALIAN